MNKEQIVKYLIKKEDVINKSDLNHLENYRNLIIFFQESLQSSFVDNKPNYGNLQESIFKCIRHLDKLINQYEEKIKLANANNSLINQIIQDHETKISVDEKKEIETIEEKS